MNACLAGGLRWLPLGAALALLGGCQDRVETFITIRHGVATMEVRVQNIWRDGIECAGAAQCAEVLEEERRSQVIELTGTGATVSAAGYAVRPGSSGGRELDLVVRYQIPVDRIDGDQIMPITVQRPSDVRTGRSGVPSIGVVHLAGSPTTVEMTGPAVRISGGFGGIAGESTVSAVEDMVGKHAPDVVVDVLTRGRGRAHVVIPSTDSDGRVQHGDAWLQTENGLEALLGERGMLIGG